MLTRVDPTTRLAALALLTTPLLLSVDVTSAAVALALELLLTPLCRHPRVLRGAWPLLVLAPLAGVSMLLYGRPGGEVYADLGPVTVTSHSVSLACAVTVRVLAVGVPSIVLLGGIDATRLGDGLAQLWRLPARPVLGAIAGARLMGLFRRDWDALSRARRARGVGDGRLARIVPVGQAFSLLVLALRRGTKIATAMEARGFRGGPRTWARPARWTGWDAVLAVGSLAVAVVALAVSVATGDFRFLGVTG
ncbi:energy-coupling factor transporter transmembrane protein EcfT [Corynebacterium bovis]|uniref:energy-coupling factor transporter transmembrane component T family protein n=1 Tax=Corynebacterium bovis TaxID=36808 RepID=UPI003139EC04